MNGGRHSLRNVMTKAALGLAVPLVLTGPPVDGLDSVYKTMPLAPNTEVVHQVDLPLTGSVFDYNGMPLDVDINFSDTDSNGAKLTIYKYEEQEDNSRDNLVHNLNILLNGDDENQQPGIIDVIGEIAEDVNKRRESDEMTDVENHDEIAMDMPPDDHDGSDSAATEYRTLIEGSKDHDDDSNAGDSEQMEDSGEEGTEYVENEKKDLPDDLESEDISPHVEAILEDNEEGESLSSDQDGSDMEPTERTTLSEGSDVSSENSDAVDSIHSEDSEKNEFQSVENQEEDPSDNQESEDVPTQVEPAWNDSEVGESSSHDQDSSDHSPVEYSTPSGVFNNPGGNPETADSVHTEDNGQESIQSVKNENEDLPGNRESEGVSSQVEPVQDNDGERESTSFIEDNEGSDQMNADQMPAPEKDVSESEEPSMFRCAYAF